MQWYMLTLISATLNSLASVTEKKTLFKEHAMEYATVISVFTFLISLIFIGKANFHISAHFWHLLIVLSILDAIAFLYITKAIRHMELSESSPLFVFGPVLTAIVAYFFLKETLTMTQAGGILGVTFGAYLLELRPMKDKKREFLHPFRVMMKSKYIHYLFFGLVLYSFAAVIGRYLLNTNNPQAIDPYALIIITHFFIAVIYIIMISFFHDGVLGLHHGMKNAGWMIFFTAVLLFASRVFLTFAFTIPVAEVALILGVRRLSSLFTTILGGEIFHDKRLSRKMVACSVMVLSAFFIMI